MSLRHEREIRKEDKGNRYLSTGNGEGKKVPRAKGGREVAQRGEEQRTKLEVEAVRTRARTAVTIECSPFLLSAPSPMCLA